MKALKSKVRKDQLLSQRLNRRLISYATAAAGASVLGLGQPAEAEIVFTPVHVTIGSHTSYPLSLTNSGTAEFLLHGSVTANSSTLFDALLAKPAPQNAVEGANYLGLNVAKALNAGERIGSSQRFVNQGRGGVLLGEAIYSPGGGQYRGNWVHTVNHYLGLQFQINGETHFGWARLTVDLSLTRPIRALLTGYAYETQPNTPIVAGQEHGQSDSGSASPQIESSPNALLPDPLGPQPASLGVLALGARGLSFWRRE
jgi:hypothetical protein